MAVAGWVKNLTEDVMGGPPVQIGKYYEHPEDGPIKIVSGQYWGRDGLSNFWDWEVCNTGEKHHGYGREWPRINVPESKALSFVLSALVHALNNGDLPMDTPIEWFRNFIHQCAVGRYDNGYIKNDPRL